MSDPKESEQLPEEQPDEVAEGDSSAHAADRKKGDDSAGGADRGDDDAGKATGNPKNAG